MNKSLKNYFNKCFFEEKICATEPEFKSIIDTLLESEEDVYPTDVNNDIKYVISEFDEIFINASNDIKLLKSIEYEEYDLLIDNYLLPDTKLDKNEIASNFIRLEQMKGNFNYNEGELNTKIDEIIDRLYNRKEENVIPLSDFISSYDERGNRLTESEIYNCYGKYPVYSSTVTGPYGYYRESNKKVNSRCLIYTIEGSNAGYILIPKSKEIFLTDVAGIIEISEKYAKVYNISAIAIYLQHLFIKNRHNNGKQPKFLLKRNLKLQINLGILDLLTKLY